jgi:hypothetical protein
MKFMFIDLFSSARDWIPYIKYLSWERWIFLIILFTLSVTLLAVTFVRYLTSHQYDWESLYNIVLLVAGINLLSPLIIIGGIYPAIERIRSQYGKAVAIKPYNGKWLFEKDRKWYWGVWAVEDETGTRFAVITLGGDIKEAVKL